jgi:arginyl-tRNA synthetase
MINIELNIAVEVAFALKQIYSLEIDPSLIQVQKTRKEFNGDYTLVVFPLLKFTRSTPEKSGSAIGEYLKENLQWIDGFNVIKGFLNLVLSHSFWKEFLSDAAGPDFLRKPPGEKHIMVEFSSPNTNKPLHLGHIRNNLLGFSISRILEANGIKVTRVNLVNDRGIHICKSMLAWKKWGNGETPESSGKKGDHLVGEYYVKFDHEYKNEISRLLDEGLTKEEAEINSGLMKEVREMLRDWEDGREEIISVWKTMNSWVYEGFDETYSRLGVEFDKIYYESETYSLGKDLVFKGLRNGTLYKKEDGSVWIDLTSEGLDHKLLLRADGTSVYMTQDLGTAHQRFNEFHIDNHVYVVGNEQNYHFQVLSLVLKKLGFAWAEKLYHLSYGMVELPAGKMKSREGTVVDADDLLDEMVSTAKQMSDELGKLNEFTQEDKDNIYNIIGFGALKYFILKVDPRKNMTFDPKESIDFNGNTGPFIQYTYTRIKSVLRKAIGIDYSQIKNGNLNEKEVNILKLIYEYNSVVTLAAESYNPALIANHIYELTREYNQFYHDYSILSAEGEDSRNFRLLLSEVCGNIIERGMFLLGIDVPERM